MEALTIKSADEAWEYIEQDLDGFIKDLPGIKFEGWPTFSIKVTGAKYNSTLPSGMLPALYELQLALYRIYAEATNRSVKNLSQKERSELEIIFNIQQGSSDVKADFSEALNTIAKGIKMKSGHVALSVLGIAAMITADSMFSTYKESEVSKSANDLEAKRIEQQNRLLDRIPIASTAQSEAMDATTAVLKSVQGADSVTVNSTTFNTKELEEVVKRKASPKKDDRLDGYYKINSLKVKEDIFRLELTNVETDQSFVATWIRENFGFDDQERLMKALTFDLPIGLNIFAKVSAGNISAASILGVQTDDDTSNEEINPDELLAALEAASVSKTTKIE